MLYVTKFYETMKPRVMYLSIFTSLSALIAAYYYSYEDVDYFSGILIIFFISLGAGASGALNMWWDSDIDSIMERTHKRPIPAGFLHKNSVLFLGIFLSIISVLGLLLISNVNAAFLLAFTIFFYVVIYTMILKRKTPQNIVIGGAAGALPPLIAWSAVTGEVTGQAILLFLIIFYWTPPHFWSLSIFSNSDYMKAGIPMLTVTHGIETTVNKIVLYTALTAISVAMYFILVENIPALIIAILLSLDFLRRAYELKLTESKEFVARKVFLFSIKYLFAIYTLILVDPIIKMLTIYL